MTGVVTGERCRGHPAASAVHDMAHGLKHRALKCAAGQPTDLWVQFAKPDAQGELQPYFYEFGSGTSLPSFPDLSTENLGGGICPFPLRVLETSAAAVAKVGRTLTLTRTRTRTRTPTPT